MKATTVAEIAEMAARLRRIQLAGDTVDPAERAAAIQAKRELIARIEATTR